MPTPNPDGHLGAREIYWRLELAAKLGVRPRTFDEYVADGRFPPADKYIGTRPAWLRRTVDQFLTPDA